MKGTMKMIPSKWWPFGRRAAAVWVDNLPAPGLLDSMDDPEAALDRAIQDMDMDLEAWQREVLLFKLAPVHYRVTRRHDGKPPRVTLATLESASGHRRYAVELDGTPLAVADDRRRAETIAATLSKVMR